jgi:hypothetical protein
MSPHLAPNTLMKCQCLVSRQTPVLISDGTVPREIRAHEVGGRPEEGGDYRLLLQARFPTLL